MLTNVCNWNMLRNFLKPDPACQIDPCALINVQFSPTLIVYLILLVYSIVESNKLSLNLGKDEMLNIIKHGAKTIFASKDDESIDIDVDALMEIGEKKTAQEKEKLDTLGESNLRSFTLDTKPEDSVYNFEGEDFRQEIKVYFI